MKFFNLVNKAQNIISNRLKINQAVLGRLPVFDAKFYIKEHTDLKLTSEKEAKKHWLSKGIKQGRSSSPVFDVVFYSEQNTDIKNEYGNNYKEIIQHWLLHGINEGRVSSPHFDFGSYVEDYPFLLSDYKHDNLKIIERWLSELQDNSGNVEAGFEQSFSKGKNNIGIIDAEDSTHADGLKLDYTLIDKSEINALINKISAGQLVEEIYSSKINETISHKYIEELYIEKIIFSPNERFIVKINIPFKKITLLDVSLDEHKFSNIVYYIYEGGALIDLPIPLIIDKRIIFQKENLTLSLTIDSEKTLSQKIAFPKYTVGRIDRSVGNKLYGWAYQSGMHPISISLFIDDIYYRDYKVNKARKDLELLGLENPNVGFEISIPTNIVADRFSIKFKDSDIALKVKKETFLKALKQINSNDKKRFLAEWQDIYHNLTDNPLTIIIPIYNAYEDVIKCVESLIDRIPTYGKLLLINDGSPDERISELLDSYLVDNKIEVIHNEKNIGYTKTINKAIKYALDREKCDIILLNSDTIVTDGWARNLRHIAYSKKEVGTVTARSNNAGAFSVPNVGTNIIPDYLSIPEMGLLLRQIEFNYSESSPTGNGFCLYIKNEVFKKIGLFDDVNFPIGYGEENDFCMRAIGAGFSNVISNSTYVYHKRSASFKESKVQLMKAGRKKMDLLHPSYSVRVSQFLTSEIHNRTLHQVRRTLAQFGGERKLKKRILFVISTLTGGTPKTNMDLMANVNDYYEPFLLHCNSKKIRLFRIKEKQELLETHELKENILLQDVNSVEYEKLVSQFLHKYAIDLLHIRHIGWHSISLPKVATKLEIPVVFSFHDFYTICPNVNLLDENLNYCGGKCTETEGECSKGIWKSHDYTPPLKHKFVYVWQNRMIEMFNYIDVCITTSVTSKDILCNIYPQLKNKNFQVIPHGRNFSHISKSAVSLSKKPSLTEKIKILIPGNITSSKGVEKIIALKEQDHQNLLELHFLGSVANYANKELGIYHGKYTREDFVEKVKSINPSFSIIFSIWPETFCHTLTESWASGIPIITFGMGAVGERVKRFDGGWIISKELSPVDMYKEVLSIAQSSDYLQKVYNILHWQMNYMVINSVKYMGFTYKKIYGSLLLNQNAINGVKKEVYGIGVLTGNNATSHIRVREWLKQYEFVNKFVSLEISADDILSDAENHLKFDLLIIQRNILPELSVSLIIEKLAERGIPYIYEIDDDLFSVPSDKDENEVYSSYRDSLKILLENARSIITTNQELKSAFEGYNDNIHIIPNYLDQKLWLAPPIKKNNLNVDSEVSLLYMGNFTHKEDLELVLTSIEKIRSTGIDVKLYVVGGFREEVEEKYSEWLIKIPISDKNKEYNNFVQWFRAIAHNFDLAIAPLKDTEFNRRKSYLKYLQYAIVNIPVLASNIHPYNEIIRHEVNGFLIENTDEAWSTGLLNVITSMSENEIFVKEISNNAYELIVNHHLKKSHLNKFEEVIINSL